jgi:type II secretion system protein H
MISPGSGYPIAVKRLGFTLVEVLLVVLIISLLAAAGGGLYVNSYQKRLVEKSAQELLLATKYARMAAIERQRICRLYLDRQRKCFFITLESFDEDSGRIKEKMIKNPYQRPTRLAGDTEFVAIKMGPHEQPELDNEPRDQAVVFRPDGTTDGAVVILGQGGHFFTLALAPGAGKATLSDHRVTKMETDTVDLDAP